MSSSAEYLRSVVRVFPDFADTVLWFTPGPVSYGEAKISNGLRDQMIVWETAWYAGLTDDHDWRSPAVENEIIATGERLARLLSDELGDSFEVEFHAIGNSSRMRVRGSGPGNNPAAVEAFRRMAQQGLEAEQEVEALKASGAELCLVGVSPITGRVYRPNWPRFGRRRARLVARTVLLVCGPLILAFVAIRNLRRR